MVGIGNPDRRGTEFWRAFNDPAMAAEYDLHTISAFDLPTLTGEVVYPDDPERQAQLLRGLTSRKWVEHKQRIWIRNGKKDARYLAKVEGNFPGDDDFSFFAQDDLLAASERDINPDGQAAVLGVDVAAMGEDESVVHVNRGGNIRVFSEEIPYKDGDQQRTTSGVWSKEDEVTTARRIHAIALHTRAREVRVDAAGLGGGIASILMRLEEFAGAEYQIIRVVGSASSTDKSRWARARDENHDAVRTMLRDGDIDIDPSDKVLMDQFLAVTWEPDHNGAIKITPKKDLRSEMHGSPDRLDSYIYAAIDTSPLTQSRFGDADPGSIVHADPFQLLNVARHGAGMPI